MANNYRDQPIPDGTGCCDHIAALPDKIHRKLLIAHHLFWHRNASPHTFSLFSAILVTQGNVIARIIWLITKNLSEIAIIIGTHAYAANQETCRLLGRLIVILYRYWTLALVQKFHFNCDLCSKILVRWFRSIIAIFTAQYWIKLCWALIAGGVQKWRDTS